VQIVDHASVPQKPVKTNKLLMVTMGLIGALVVGVGGAFGLESLYTTVHGRRDGEMRLGIPVLTVIPEAV
jgi:capsular polysaccharide biosynthesis protein